MSLAEFFYFLFLLFLFLFFQFCEVAKLVSNHSQKGLANFSHELCHFSLVNYGLKPLSQKKKKNYVQFKTCHSLLTT
jgi:hypothetical protein